jgi:hypothetical protein
MAQGNSQQRVVDTAVPRRLVLKLSLHLVRTVDDVNHISVRRRFTHASALVREQLIVAVINVRFHYSSDIIVQDAHSFLASPHILGELPRTRWKVAHGSDALLFHRVASQSQVLEQPFGTLVLPTFDSTALAGSGGRASCR